MKRVVSEILSSTQVRYSTPDVVVTTGNSSVLWLLYYDDECGNRGNENDVGDVEVTFMIVDP